ncbi:hypothetical protein SteCoe_1079 [Stentor coeruleus]|uniref:F5/8 type C domain-containing protein n=1 Tax=Stentor coeruleus TaxID=5963 RepID=A0A1R2D2P5_9CILI|nr:hypothetical protein SteCoe_1079 [Stentor coeruleus]
MAKVLMSTSYDPNFPPENVLTNNTKEFWMSTGLFPQEILLSLSSPSTPRNLRLACSNVRHVVIEGCEGNHLGNFTKVGETEIGSNGGDIQKETVDLNVSRPVNFLKIVFLSGWDEFISVHLVKVD